MALLEKEAIRFAASLDDYEHVSAVDIGGNEPHDYRLVVRGPSFPARLRDLVPLRLLGLHRRSVDHTQYKALPVRKEVA